MLVIKFIKDVNLRRANDRLQGEVLWGIFDLLHDRCLPRELSVRFTLFKIDPASPMLNAHARPTVRMAVFPGDGATVEELLREYAGSLGIDLAFQQFDEELAGLPGKYAPPGGRLLLAHVGTSPAGCVALRPLSAGDCEMKRLYVRPAMRGRGIGRRLVQQLLDEARQAGYGRILLDTLPSMRGAIALYESFGFRETQPYSYSPVPGARFLVLQLNAMA